MISRPDTLVISRVEAAHFSIYDAADTPAPWLAFLHNDICRADIAMSEHDFLRFWRRSQVYAVDRDNATIRSNYSPDQTCQELDGLD